jgi:hypothetical protein
LNPAGPTTSCGAKSLLDDVLCRWREDSAVILELAFYFFSFISSRALSVAAVYRLGLKSKEERERAKERTKKRREINLTLTQFQSILHATDIIKYLLGAALLQLRQRLVQSPVLGMDAWDGQLTAHLTNPIQLWIS